MTTPEHAGTGSEPEPPRLTPYELAFGLDAFEVERFPSIREEAQARELDVSAPDRFVFLTVAAELLRAIAGADAEPAGPDADGTVVGEFGRLLFHAYRFWDAGRALLAVGPEPARALLDPGASAGDWGFRAPSPAGYVQLPRQLLWGRAAPSSPAEPVDGFFWALGRTEPELDAADRLFVLAALGLRPDRPGFTVIPVDGPVAEAGRWLAESARPGGDDFANILPGGELEELLGIEREAELLKLAARVFRHIDRYPESVSAERTAPATEPEPHRLPATGLPYRAVGPGHG